MEKDEEENKCPDCGSELKVKTIIINQWISGTCMNVGTYYRRVVYCPKCDPEPRDRIEHV